MRVVKSVFILVVSALIACASLPTQAQGTPPAEVKLNYAKPGPHAVGRAWFKGPEKGLVLVAWYPVTEGSLSGASLVVPTAYRLPAPNVKILESVGNWGTAALNAIPDSSQGPYPLVIFSTGSPSSPADYAYLEEHLASYGFVVITPHRLIEDNRWTPLVSRPMTLPRVIDMAELLNSQDGSFKGILDLSHIGVTGHSLGGYVALTAAGAQLDLAWFENHCANTQETNGLCAELLGHKQDMLALARLDAMPPALWPSWGDPRVTAIVCQAGLAEVFGPSGLAPVTVPVMFQVGSADDELFPDANTFLAYNSISSSQKAQVVFEGGRHLMFGDAFDGWTVERAHDTVNHFTTAFLLDMLKGDTTAHQALLPEAVQFSDIHYTTTLK
jgi:predicted dienelactone hydrolase